MGGGGGGERDKCSQPLPPPSEMILMETWEFAFTGLFLHLPPSPVTNLNIPTCSLGGGRTRGRNMKSGGSCFGERRVWREECIILSLVCVCVREGVSMQTTCINPVLLQTCCKAHLYWRDGCGSDADSSVEPTTSRAGRSCPCAGQVQSASGGFQGSGKEGGRGRVAAGCSDLCLQIRAPQRGGCDLHHPLALWRVQRQPNLHWTQCRPPSLPAPKQVKIGLPHPNLRWSRQAIGLHGVQRRFGCLWSSQRGKWTFTPQSPHGAAAPAI